MTPRHVLMGVALVGAAALVLFGDNTPDSGVAQPSERHVPKNATTAAATNAAATAATSAATNAAMNAATAAAGTNATATVATGATTTAATAAMTSAAGQPPAGAAQPAPPPEAAARNGKAAPAEVAILRLIPREQLVGEPGDTVIGGANGMFGMQSFTPPPPPPPKPAPPPPPPPPMAPPLPYAYIGKALSDGVWEVFLTRGPDRTLIARNQMVLDGAYRVDAITPPVMKLTYLPLNQVQQLNIGVAE